MKRLTVILSATVVGVALAGATLGNAAVQGASKKVVPFAKKAGFATKAGTANRAKVATNADAVDGIGASTTPAAGKLLPLGSNGQFPSSVIPSGGGSFWSLSGNEIDSNKDFLGTTNDQPLIMRTSNVPRMLIEPGGDVVVDERLRTAGDSGVGLEGDGLDVGVSGLLHGSNCPVPFAGVAGCSAIPAGASVPDASNLNDVGVRGISAAGLGVSGSSNTGHAVEGFSLTGIGVLGDSATRGIVGTLEHASCPGSYAVGGCAGPAAADGVVGSSSEGAAMRAVSTSGGTIFLGESPGGTPKARIDGTGKGFFDGGTQTGGADYAESIRAAGGQTLAAGDVLAVTPGSGFAVGKARAAGSPLVVGVYSTKPAVLAVGSHGVDASLKGEVPVAMLGVVPTKATAENGSIRAGDLLTTARTSGYAMKAKSVVVRGVRLYGSGTILGKALQPLTHGTGVIRVLLMLR